MAHGANRGSLVCQARTIVVWLMEQTEGFLFDLFVSMSACDSLARTIDVWLMEQIEGLVHVGTLVMCLSC